MVSVEVVGSANFRILRYRGVWEEEEKLMIEVLYERLVYVYALKGSVAHH